MTTKSTYFGNSVPVNVVDNALSVVDIREDGNRAAFGELLVTQLSPKAAWRFDYGTVPNTRLYTTTTANGGSASISQSRLVLGTGVNTAGLARLQSQRRLRYLPGMGGLVRFTAVFGTPKNNSSQLIGQGDTQDGFLFGYKGTAFGIVLRRSGTDTFVGSDAWNGEKVNINPALGNVYQIRYQWLGFGFIRFYILHPTDPLRGFVLVHTILYPNTSLVTSILNPTLPLFAEVLNSGNNTDVSLMTPSAMAALEGESSTPYNPLNVGNSFDALATFANTSNDHLLTIRNKSTFGGVANRVPVMITVLNIGRSASGANTSTIRLYRNATTAGVLTFADIDTNNSPVEVSTTTTTITSVNAERAYSVTSSVTAQSIEFKDQELILQPGESLSIGIQDGGVQSTDFVVTTNWLEQF